MLPVPAKWSPKPKFIRYVLRHHAKSALHLSRPCSSPKSCRNQCGLEDRLWCDNGGTRGRCPAGKRASPHHFFSPDTIWVKRRIFDKPRGLIPADTAAPSQVDSCFSASPRGARLVVQSGTRLMPRSSWQSLAAIGQSMSPWCSESRQNTECKEKYPKKQHNERNNDDIGGWNERR